MKKKNLCMENQIDLASYQDYMIGQRKKHLMKKSNKLGNIPFCYFIFRKVYRKLKESGSLVRTDILEYKVPVNYEIYEALYVNTLRAIYLQCRKEINNEKMYQVLSDMYEHEFEWMEKRAFVKCVDTA